MGEDRKCPIHNREGTPTFLAALQRSASTFIKIGWTLSPSEVIAPPQTSARSVPTVTKNKGSNGHSDFLFHPSLLYYIDIAVLGYNFRYEPHVEALAQVASWPSNTVFAKTRRVAAPSSTVTRLSLLRKLPLPQKELGKLSACVRHIVSMSCQNHTPYKRTNHS